MQQPNDRTAHISHDHGSADLTARENRQNRAQGDNPSPPPVPGTSCSPVLSTPSLSCHQAVVHQTTAQPGRILMEIGQDLIDPFFRVADTGLERSGSVMQDNPEPLLPHRKRYDAPFGRSERGKD